MDWPFPLQARNNSAAARAGRAHWCHSKPSTILLFMVFVPNSLTAASPLKVHFISLNLKPCHFSQPPHCSCKYRLLINSLSLQWQTASFNSDWWKIYIITKLPLASFCHLQDLPETWSPKAEAELLLTDFKEWEEFVSDQPPHLDFQPPPSARI